jgi:hypothetical protein
MPPGLIVPEFVMSLVMVALLSSSPPGTLHCNFKRF